MQFTVAVEVRLESGCRYTSKESIISEDDLAGVQTLVARALAGAANEFHLTTEKGRIYFPLKLLETAVITVFATPVDSLM